MQLPPLPDTSARHRSIVENPQLAAPWFEIAHQLCATALSAATVPAADRTRAVRAARMSCPVWQTVENAMRNATTQYAANIVQSKAPFEVSWSPSTPI